LSRAFEAHPKLNALESSLKVALNEEITREDAELKDGDRVALLPPVVGG
jgi:molybdopterin converting factor small subunit